MRKDKNRIILNIVTLCFGVTMFFSCRESVNPESFFEPEERTPVMIAENIETTYTDSSKLKLIFKAPIVVMYDSTETLPEKQEAPKGVDITFMDEQGKPKNRITSDYARLLQETNTWEVRKNVVVRSTTEGQTVLTEKLYWDQNNKKIYNSVYTQVISDGDTLEAHNGIDATEDLSKIVFNQTSGIFNVNSEE